MGCEMEQGHLCEQYSLLLEMKIRLNGWDIYIYRVHKWKNHCKKNTVQSKTTERPNLGQRSNLQNKSTQPKIFKNHLTFLLSLE
jgi:hypothetical protein